MLVHAVNMRRGDGPASEGNDGRGSADANADAAEERQRLTAITEHLMNNLDFARGFVDDVSVKYVRGDALLQYMMRTDVTDCGLDAITDEESAIQLIESMLEHNDPVLLMHMDRRMQETKDKDGTVKRKALRRDGKVCLTTVSPSRRTRFDPKGRYVWCYEPSSTWLYVKAALLLLAFFACCLYRQWPYWLQVCIWYLAVTLLILLLGIIVLRLVVFVVCWSVGFDVWILPRLLEDVGPSDLISPPFTAERSEGYWWLRIAVLVALLAAGYHIYSQPTEFDEFLASQRDFVADLYEGKLLSDVPDLQNQGRAGSRVPSLDELMREFELQDQKERVGMHEDDGEDMTEDEEILAEMRRDAENDANWDEYED